MVTTLFKILQPELDLVRQRLQEETSIQGRTVPGLIWPVLNHLDQNLLPAIVLFSAHSQGYYGPRALSLAAVFQFIFLASFIHNNIKQEVPRQTLVGDYFYTRFFDLLCRDGNLEFLAPLSRLICRIHLDAARLQEKTGESTVTNLVNPFPERLRTREYLAAAAASLGSRLGPTAPGELRAWEETGLLLGKLWDGQAVAAKSCQVVEKMAAGRTRDFLSELVLELDGDLPVKRVMAL